MQRSIWVRLNSRKFLSVLLYAAFILMSEILGWPISYEAYAAIGTLLGLFVVGESYIDGQGAKTVK